MYCVVVKYDVYLDIRILVTAEEGPGVPCVSAYQGPIVYKADVSGAARH